MVVPSIEHGNVAIGIKKNSEAAAARGEAGQCKALGRVRNGDEGLKDVSDGNLAGPSGTRHPNNETIMNDDGKAPRASYEGRAFGHGRLDHLVVPAPARQNPI